MSTQTVMIHLSPQRCAELLAGSDIGRVGVVVEGRPEIYPVDHVYVRDRGEIVFPVKDGTRLSIGLRWPWVAFEADGVDADDPRGGCWSVLVVGHAEDVADADTEAAVATARRHGGVGWPAGSGSRWVRIVPAEITGRHVDVCRR